MDYEIKDQLRVVQVDIVDLLVILLLTIVTLPLVIFTGSIPKTMLGIAFVFVSPGFSLI